MHLFATSTAEECLALGKAAGVVETEPAQRQMAEGTPAAA
jgi:hypothetical protein